MFDGGTMESNFLEMSYGLCNPQFSAAANQNFVSSLYLDRHISARVRYVTYNIVTRNWPYDYMTWMETWQEEYKDE
jgi:hypothetical protein